MQITLLPSASLPGSSSDTVPRVNGDVLEYRGQIWDLSPLPEGATIELGEPFVDAVSRLDGMIQCTLQYSFDTSTAESSQSKELADYTFIVTDGECPCPIQRKRILAQSDEEPADATGN